MTVDDLVHADSVGLPLARGFWMCVSDAAVKLFVPRLFEDRPIVLRPDELAVCRPEEMPPPDAQLSRPPPRKLALSHLQKGRDDANLFLVLAHERVFRRYATAPDSPLRVWCSTPHGRGRMTATTSSALIVTARSDR